MIDKRNEPVSSSLAALRTAVQAANSLVPGVMVVFCLVMALVIAVSLLSVTLMEGMAVLVVVSASLFVYFKSNDYAEASVTLAVGLLTLFTVDWTTGRFIAFIVAWVGLMSLILLISSVKLAAKAEAIYVFAAQFAGMADLVAARKALEAIGKDRNIPGLGPIECAEVIRVLAVRKVPVSVMSLALSRTAMFVVLTKLDCITIAGVVADIYALTNAISPEEWQTVSDLTYEALLQSSVTPEVFIDAFNEGRRSVLSGKADFVSFLRMLQSGLALGVPASHMLEFISATPS
jgi:hypothetical protein